MIHLLWISVLAFLAFITAYVVATLGLKSKARWFGLAAIMCAMPFAFLVGQVTAEFDTDVCYSIAWDKVATAAEATADPRTIAARIRALPFSGYETQCDDVVSAAERWAANAGSSVGDR
jgi:hypothetical protein